MADIMAATPRMSHHMSDTLIDPVDLSFNDIESMTEATTVEPRINSPRKTPRQINQFEDSNNSTKKKSNSLRLCYNKLSNTDGFSAAVGELIEDPQNLKWLDLSFNNITKIDPVWSDYENLQILYLHGNNIKDLRELDKLSGMKSLRKLTLHGNEIENEPDYRKYVVSKFPNLISLDFCTLTKGDRANACYYEKMGGMKQRKKSKKDKY